MRELVGSKIEGSRYLRDYCYRCQTPMRVVRCWDDDGNRITHICCECSPKHVGCTSPSSPLDDDAYKVSIQEPYGNMAGS